MGIIWFLLVMGVIALVHEFGHFIVAKLFNVYCHEFSIGMGPKLYQKKIGETKYSLRALPIGGYVMMASGRKDEVFALDKEDSNYQENSNNNYVNVPYHRSLKGISKFKQMLVVLAGAFMNYVLAFVLILGIYISKDEVVVPPENTIINVSENSPAQIGGLKENDKVIKITTSEGFEFEIKDFYDIVMALNSSNETFTFEVQREGQIETLSITPKFDEQSQRYLIGIDVPQPTYRKMMWYEPFSLAVETTIDQSLMIFDGLKMLISGKHLDSLSGPIGIYEVVEEQAQAGIIPYLSLIALLSINIGIFNLLPVPALDGGRFLIMVYEALTKKEVNEKVEIYITMVGFILLIGLLFFATFNDLSRIFS